MLDQAGGETAAEIVKAQEADDIGERAPQRRLHRESSRWVASA